MKATLASIMALMAGCITGQKCKCFPDEPCWPSLDEWAQLNNTVDGRLIATTPLGQQCHDPEFNAPECDYLKEHWDFVNLHMNDSASVMSPYFANQSCDPFTARATPCTLGNYVQYAVAVQSYTDVINTISFAKSHNIRFVIRNTGHDYLGRSTGAGALSVWTHHLKNITFKNWEDSFYKGKAVKLGAGVQGYDIMAAAKDEGVVVVGGECPTVGPAGGYTQGGGHSALSTSFGLSADNTVEWEVVTANGELLTASRTENTDLYWALSGGGAGNYGVVLSMTVKVFPDAAVASASLVFVTSNNPPDRFWEAVDAFHKALPDIIDAGCMVVYDITDKLFQLAPLTAYNKSEASTREIMAPLLQMLDTMNITYFSGFGSSASYYDHYNQYFGPLPFGAITLGVSRNSGRVGGRLIPRSVVQNNNTGVGAVARFVTEHGVAWVGVATNVKQFADSHRNAVLPAWRDALVHVILTAPLASNFSESGIFTENKDLMTATIMPAMEGLTPGSGAYMNEADFRQPNFQEEFFGSNYDRLLNIKKKYDPENLFYAVKAVGSEAWDVLEDGRLCRAAVP